ncbi:hypothetical protein A9Q99_05595 [Gammaproteobacteria bacterium 45_16_T64]|nr:hypothetical protein A9Q99_05595 [Gammaproteobacteria bacterium 45_16_T64]
MSTRAEQKQRTREAIIEAALRKLNEDKGLSSLSLREVAKEAGIAPTSFYRHFENLDALGLELVEKATEKLHVLLKMAKQSHAKTDDITQNLVGYCLDHFKENGNLFRVLAREAVGSSVTLRQAIQKELRQINKELAHLIELESRLKQRNITDPKMVAEAISTIIFYMGVSTIDLPYAMRQDAEKRLIHHIKAIYNGSEVMANRLHLERQMMLS